MDLIADGLQVALLWEMRQQGLHAAVELLLTLKLEKSIQNLNLNKNIKQTLPINEQELHFLQIKLI